MHPAAIELCEVLDDLVEKAPYEADPRVSMTRFSAAFAAYLRSPD
jgi:hypothetical protein